MITFHIDSYVQAIDNKNIDEIKILIKNNIDIYKDIVFEIYKNGLLTSKRLQFLVKLQIFKNHLSFNKTIVKRR